MKITEAKNAEALEALKMRLEVREREIERKKKMTPEQIEAERERTMRSIYGVNEIQ